MIGSLLLLVGVVAEAAPPGPTAPGPPAESRLLIFETEAPNVMDPAQKSLYDDLFEEILAEVAGVEVIGRRDLRAMIDANVAISRTASCSDDECMYSVADIVDVRFFLTGRYSLIDDEILLTVKVYDRGQKRVAVRATGTLKGDHRLVRPALRQLATEVIDRMGEAAPGWRPRVSLWRQLDTLGMVGIGTIATGLVGLGIGVVFSVMAADESSAVQRLTDGRLSDQLAAQRANTFGWIASGAFIVGATLAVTGGLLTYFGWSDATPRVGVQVDNEAVGFHVQLAF